MGREIQNGKRPRALSADISDGILRRAIERARGSDFGGDRPLEFAVASSAARDFLAAASCSANEKKSRCGIARRSPSLAIHLSGVVSLPECIQQLFRNSIIAGSKVTCHYFRVPGFIGANILYVGLGISPPL